MVGRYKEAAQAAHESGKRAKALALAARGRRAGGAGERPGPERSKGERSNFERSKGERSGERPSGGRSTSHLATQPFVPQREVD